MLWDSQAAHPNQFFLCQATWNSPWARRREYTHTTVLLWFEQILLCSLATETLFLLLYIEMKTGWNGFLGARVRIPGFFPWIEGHMTYNNTQVSFFTKILVGSRCWSWPLLKHLSSQRCWGFSTHWNQWLYPDICNSKTQILSISPELHKNKLTKIPSILKIYILMPLWNYTLFAWWAKISKFFSLLTICFELTHIPELVHRWKKLEDMQGFFTDFLAFPRAKGPDRKSVV